MREGATCYMYLDDLVIISQDEAAAARHFTRARPLLKELGLPEAEDKAQPLARTVKWLGVHIDAEKMTISFPKPKLQEVLRRVRETMDKKTITKKQLQSLLGHLLFIANCIRPARIFVSRLLTAL